MDNDTKQAIISQLTDKLPAFDPTWQEAVQQTWFAAWNRVPDLVVNNGAPGQTPTIAEPVEPIESHTRLFRGRDDATRKELRDEILKRLEGGQTKQKIAVELHIGPATLNTLVAGTPYGPPNPRK